MLKKIVAILLIVLLAGATTACASDQDDDQDVEQFNWVLAGYKKAPATVVEEQLFLSNVTTVAIWLFW